MKLESLVKGGGAGTDAGQIVEIHTLGRFGIISENEPARSTGKSHQRPPALLKFLVARGGHAVSCSLISEALWPDAEGDLGAGCLTVTLHRLRQRLGQNAAVLCHEGRLSLNEHLCWLDVWQFERQVNEALLVPPEDRDRAWEASLRHALDLYQGHFLALEAEEAWMLEPRARWKIKFERATAALAGHLEKEDCFQEAIDVCLNSLEIDPCNELLYRRLMACYLKQGEPSSAIRAYAECRNILAKGFGACPAPETEVLYRTAVGADAALNSRGARASLTGSMP